MALAFVAAPHPGAQRASAAGAPAAVGSGGHPTPLPSAPLPAAAAGTQRGTAAAAAAGGLLLAKALSRRRRRHGRGRGRVQLCAGTSSEVVAHQVLQLKQLGGSAFDKALQVNLDPTLYGSFAEIGAGQEVSRTFLTAGAAAGTVARSLSAYDMQLSDVTYGKSKRYVTEERLLQMLNKEYDVLEENLRETKGPETRFFSFATTLAAKAYMSNRECEGWMGFTFQHEAGAKPSTVALHIRMCDNTAQLQGEAIGILGTNLIYLCNAVKDPYLIASFLLDGIANGRLEIDYIDFSGPNWPEGSVDQRLLAMRMAQFRVAVSVLLDYDEETGRYKQVVPNTALYKRSVVVQRSRFRPSTYSHREIMDAAGRQLVDRLGPDAKAPMKILNLQIDDIVRPKTLVQTETRLDRTRKLVEADADSDGLLSVAELRALASQKMPEEEVDELIAEVDIEGKGTVSIDGLLGLCRESLLVMEFLDRFNMVEPLKFPILVSGLRRNHSLATYLHRYTSGEIVVTVGGGNYSIERGLFNEKSYKEEKGGMLAAFGRLFQRNVQIFQFPNVSPEGKVTTSTPKDTSPVSFLHMYLRAEDKIVVIDEKYISPEVLDEASNVPFRGQSEDVMQLIIEGSEDWTKYVPEEVAAIIKKRTWFGRLSSGKGLAGSVYAILNEL